MVDVVAAVDGTCYTGAIRIHTCLHSGSQGERRPRESGDATEVNPDDADNRGRGGRGEGRGGRGGRGGRRDGDGRRPRREYDRHDATGRG